MGEQRPVGRVRRRWSRVGAGASLVALLLVSGCGDAAGDTPLPDAMQGSQYAVTLSAGIGQPPYVWAITRGTLPAGLTLDGSTGHIFGTAVAVGTSSFSVEVRDRDDKRRTQELSITVLVPGSAAVVRTGPGDRRRGPRGHWTA